MGLSIVQQASSHPFGVYNFVKNDDMLIIMHQITTPKKQHFAEIEQF